MFTDDITFSVENFKGSHIKKKIPNLINSLNLQDTKSTYKKYVVILHTNECP